MKLTRIAAALTAVLAAAPVTAADVFTFSNLWTFTHGDDAGTATGGGSEIVAFDATTQNLWVVGTDAEFADVGVGGVDIIDLGGNLVNSISLPGVNSVAIRDGVAAVAATAATKTQNGTVSFFNTTSLANQQTVIVGANPDNVAWTPGGKVLVANEGEPNSYNQADSFDPAGSIGIIDTANAFAYTEAFFGAFDANSLKAAGVRLNGPNATVTQDLEPEFIAVSADGSTAVATLQEANAVAVVDVATGTVTAVKSMGLKDHSTNDTGYFINGEEVGNRLDASDRDGVDGNLQNWNVKGLYMPDSVAGFTQGGQQYYVTANEGDGRDYDGFLDEIRIGDIVSGDKDNPDNFTIDPALEAELIAAHGVDWQTSDAKLKRLTATTTGDLDGNGTIDELQVFGGRSFSILDADGDMVFDSGDFLESVIASDFPDLWVEGRSDNKGPEPEAVVVGEVAGNTLLFLGLERSSAIAVFDLTDLSDVTFVDMIFTAGDVSPEGLAFFTDAGGMSYLAVSNEVSGTTSLYSVTPVPVPAAVWLFGSALVGLALRARRRA
jgi:3-phytase